MLECTSSQLPISPSRQRLLAIRCGSSNNPVAIESTEESSVSRAEKDRRIPELILRDPKRTNSLRVLLNSLATALWSRKPWQQTSAPFSARALPRPRHLRPARAPINIVAGRSDDGYLQADQPRPSVLRSWRSITP